MYLAVPDDMGTYGILTPAVKLCDERAVSLGLGAVLIFILKPLIIVALLAVFAKRDARTLRM